MLRRTFVALFLSALATSSAQAGESFTDVVPYRGTKLDGDVLLCKSDRVVSGGFRRDVGSGDVTQVAEVFKQHETTTWRISLKGEKADVAVFNGATQTLEGTEEFSVRRSQGRLLLVRTNTTSSTQAITIDLSNSSFVYSGQDVDGLMNKVNIFIGSCHPYM